MKNTTGMLAATAAAVAVVACSGGNPPEIATENVGAASEALHSDLLDPATPGGATTQCFGMHCCPSGYGMRGLNDSTNTLLCRQVNQQHEDCFIDGPTERSGVHACPRGTYVRGIRSDRNRLTCCYDRERGYSELNAETVDGPSSAHQEFNMHACAVPAGAGDAFMTGVNASSNKFLCASTPATPSSIPSPVNITLNPESKRTFLNFYPGTSHSTWKAAVQNWLLRQFDVPPNMSQTAPAVRVDAGPVTVEGGVVRSLISYPSAVDGTRIPAYVLYPPGYQATSTYPGVLVVHGHFDEAKDGSAVQWDKQMHATALYLAQNGFVALAPDTRSWGNYHPPEQYNSDGSLNPHYPFTDTLFSAAGNNYGTLAQQTLLDNLVSVSVLNSLAHLSRLGVEGLSLGADQAMWLAAVDNRIGDVLPAGNFISFECLNAPGMAHSCQTVPGISSNYGDGTGSDLSLGRNLLLDVADVAALIAPRRLYEMFGQNDVGQTLQSDPNTSCALKGASDARAVYSRLGISGSFFGPDTAAGNPNALGPLIPGMGHHIDNTTALQFFTRGSVRPTDQLDWGSQCNGMHCCPSGKAIAGVHLGLGVYICRDILASTREACAVEGGANQRQNMHACLANEYLRGFNAQNQFTCCHDTGSAPKLQLKNELVDANTQAQGMHTCPSSSAFMTGFRQDQNLLLCDSK